MKLPWNNVSKSTIARNPHLFPGSSRASPELERNPVHEPAGSDEAKASCPVRFLIRVESVRKRLCDLDNLCAKYHIDCLRYAGVIPTDAPDAAEIRITQRKAAKGEMERTLITVEQI